MSRSHTITHKEIANSQQLRFKAVQVNVYDSEGNLTWGQTDKQMLQVSGLTDTGVFSCICLWTYHSLYQLLADR